MKCKTSLYRDKCRRQCPEERQSEASGRYREPESRQRAKGTVRDRIGRRVLIRCLSVGAANHEQ